MSETRKLVGRSRCGTVVASCDCGGKSDNNTWPGGLFEEAREQRRVPRRPQWQMKRWQWQHKGAINSRNRHGREERLQGYRSDRGISLSETPIKLQHHSSSPYLRFYWVDRDVYLHCSLFELVPVQRNSSLVNLDKSKTIVIESGFFDANRIPTLKSTQ